MNLHRFWIHLLLLPTVTSGAMKWQTLIPTPYYLKKGSLAKIATRCLSVSLVVPLVVTRCTNRCRSLSFVVTCCITRCHSLSLVVTRCITRLSFYKRSSQTTFTCSNHQSKLKILVRNLFNVNNKDTSSGVSVVNFE